MHIKRLDFWYILYSLSAFLLTFYTIVFHIKFIFLPLFFFCFGFLTEFFFKKKGVMIFLFLLPLVNSLPGFFYNGYSFNLMAVSLFYLSGIIFSTVLTNREFPGFHKYPWAGFYIRFLSLLWISAIFIFLKWSNITLSVNAFLLDTPVAPGFPLVSRNSFASLFPLITLFLFSVPPFVVPLLRSGGFREEKVFKVLIAGFAISVLIAVFQKYFDPGFMALKWWSVKLNQYNGGFSDFNGFGFFAGALFLYSSRKLSNYILSGGGLRIFLKGDPGFYLFSSLLTLSSVFFSGSRTAFVFVLSAFIIFFFNKKIRLKKKIILITVLIIALLISGGVLKKRLAGSFEKLKDTFTSSELLSSLDKVSNNRIGMIIDSIPIFTNYPGSGIGGGNFIFYLKYLKFKEKYYEDLPLNQYLLILNELGLPGLILFILFIFSLLYGRGKNAPFLVLAVIFIVLMVGNSFWLPEIMIFFWILAAYLEGKVSSDFSGFPGSKIFFFFILFIFIVSNILNFSSLHPKTLMNKKNLAYDYGFWDESTKNNFKWTKNKSGIYLNLDENGESEELKIFCGAPVQKMDGKAQRVSIYWRNTLFRSVEFKENREFIFKIKGEPRGSGFLRFSISPTFNLKKMGLGNESRDLGVQFFPGLN